MPTYRLKTLLALQVKEEEDSDFEYRGDVWKTLGSYWSQVKPMNAATRVVANQVAADVTHAVVFRNPGFLPTHLMRMVDEHGTIYDVKTVRDMDGLEEHYELFCTVGA